VRAGTARRSFDAQKEAGNYRKGHVRIGGLDISIENPEGSERSGVDDNGSRWTNRMAAQTGEAPKEQNFTYAIKPAEGGYIIESDDGGGHVVAGRPTGAMSQFGTPPRIFKRRADALLFMKQRSMEPAKPSNDGRTPRDAESAGAEQPAEQNAVGGMSSVRGLGAQDAEQDLAKVNATERGVRTDSSRRASRSKKKNLTCPVRIVIAPGRPASSR